MDEFIPSAPRYHSDISRRPSNSAKARGDRNSKAHEYNNHNPNISRDTRSSRQYHAPPLSPRKRLNAPHSPQGRSPQYYRPRVEDSAHEHRRYRENSPKADRSVRGRQFENSRPQEYLRDDNMARERYQYRDNSPREEQYPRHIESETRDIYSFHDDRQPWPQLRGDSPLPARYPSPTAERWHGGAAHWNGDGTELSRDAPSTSNHRERHQYHPKSEQRRNGGSGRHSGRDIRHHHDQQESWVRHHRSEEEEASSQPSRAYHGVISRHGPRDRPHDGPRGPARGAPDGTRKYQVPSSSVFDLPGLLFNLTLQNVSTKRALSTPCDYHDSDDSTQEIITKNVLVAVRLVLIYRQNWSDISLLWSLVAEDLPWVPQSHGSPSVMIRKTVVCHMMARKKYLEEKAKGTVDTSEEFSPILKTLHYELDKYNYWLEQHRSHGPRLSDAEILRLRRAWKIYLDHFPKKLVGPDFSFSADWAEEAVQGLSSGDVDGEGLMPRNAPSLSQQVRERAGSRSEQQTSTTTISRSLEPTNSPTHAVFSSPHNNAGNEGPSRKRAASPSAKGHSYSSRPAKISKTPTAAQEQALTFTEATSIVSDSNGRDMNYSSRRHRFLRSRSHSPSLPPQHPVPASADSASAVKTNGSSRTAVTAVETTSATEQTGDIAPERSVLVQKNGSPATSEHILRNRLHGVASHVHNLDGDLALLMDMDHSATPDLVLCDIVDMQNICRKLKDSYARIMESL